MGPFKCPDCGIWWAGLEHRCQPIQTATGTIAVQPPKVCTCPQPIDWSHTYIGDPLPCPVHGGGTTTITYTSVS